MTKLWRNCILPCITVGFVTLLGACNLDYFEKDRFALESYPSTFAVPVMKGSLSLDDLLSADTLDKTEIQENDGILMLRAADTISIAGNDLFWLVDRVNSLEYSLSNSMITDFNSSGQFMVNH